MQEVNPRMNSGSKPEGSDMDARVQALWEQMNKGLPNKSVKPVTKTSKSSTMSTTSQKANDNWMTYLGLAPKKRGYLEQGDQQKGASSSQNGAGNEDRGLSNKMLSKQSCSSSDRTSQKTSDNWMAYLGLATKKTESTGHYALQRDSDVQNATNDETRKLAAAALSAVKDSAVAAAGRGKVEAKVRDFAGQEIEVKKLVDAESKEARASSTSAVDAVLEQIKKKAKLSVLDKTKKDWGEFKEENRGLEDELDAYKKSSNQYLDKVSFLQRTDYREFERERDARLAQQARRRTDMREDDL
ncbi:Craniofacial development protein, putative [Ricinus communis]|uniref:Craniofacial development protein, putative n=1 Tax=Ricinus communis TaxID=3988 RepID=B9RZW6_RICCO|nr:Craniofacial development protein, putative [Ricinus communis]